MEKPHVSDDKQGTSILKTIVLSDYWIKILLLLAFLGCLYTVLTVQTYQNRINYYWIQEFKRSCSGFSGDTSPIFEYDFFNISRNGEIKNLEKINLSEVKI